MDGHDALAVRRPGHPLIGHQQGQTKSFSTAKFFGAETLARQPGLVSEGQSGKGNNPPKKKGRD